MSITVNSFNINNTQNNRPNFSTKAASAAGSLLGLTASAVCITKARGLKVPASLKTREVVDVFIKIEFNEKDNTWNCPCHGSIFDCYGNLVSIPATRNLKKY